MLLTKSTTFAAAALASGLFLLPAPHARAQNAAATPSASTAPGGERPEGADRREEFRQRMEERLKEQLKVSDDEWTVIQPLIEKVGEKQRAAGGFGGPGGPGGFGGPPGGRRPRENNQEGNNSQQAPADNQGGGNRSQRREGGRRGGGTPETQALRAALADDNTTVNDIKAKLQAVRDQRKQAATELAQAREELRKVLNMRQEATLVMYGLLD